MKYLLLASHATFAAGLEGALRMLLGERPFVLACGMEEGMAPQEYEAHVEETLAGVGAEDEVVLLGDIAGGSPLKGAAAVLEKKGLANKTITFGGANLPMAISAVMGIEDELGLDAIHDAMLADGAAAVREV